MSQSHQPSNDMWWATPEQLNEFRYLYFGHHDPISDDDDPADTLWFHSLDPDHPRRHTRYSRDLMLPWRQHWQNTNVYRILLLFNKEKDGIVGPFLVDIDFAYDFQALAYTEDLNKAHTVARLVALLLNNQWEVAKTDIRVFFSGRKGFNFEVRPRALGIAGDLKTQQLACERVQTKLRDALKAEGIVGLVDRVFGPRLFWLPPRHPFVRLHGSINAWRSQGTDHRGRKSEVSLDNLLTLHWEEIVSKASG